MSTRDAEAAEAESGENSPETHHGSSEKRASKKRKVLSCYACRSRKMKCDRVYPVCGRCQKTGRADQCSYDPRLLEESHVNGNAQGDSGNASFVLPENHTEDLTSVHPSPDALQWKVRTQERRIEMLERKLAAKGTSKHPSQYDDILPAEPEFKEEMMFRGKGFKTQFHGVTSVLSIIARYRELQDFTREALTVDHSIQHVRTDFKNFRDLRKLSTKEQSARTHGTDEEVFAVLPERNVVDVQVALYFKSWETTYRILHEPSFWKDYHNFWEQESGSYAQVGFAVILVLIVAITKCLTPKDDHFVGDTTVDRHDASNLIEVCDSWMSKQPRKRLTLLFFQLQSLSLLAKRINCVKLKQDWVTSGDLVRLALASGMHRDPSLLVNGRISVFEKEMKKRLWATIMELELQSSLESGLQSSLTGVYFDTPAPANLPDDAFSIDSQQLPASRPIDHFTSASYLDVTLKSLPLRIHLTQLLNNPSSDLQYSDILHYDAQIHSAISSLPRWDDDRATTSVALLRLQLRQYLLILHKPYAKLASKSQQYMYSFTTCVDAASSITTIYDDLISRGVITLNNLRNDMVRVVLTLSQVVYHNCARYGPVKHSAVPSKDPESQSGDAQANVTDPETHFAEFPYSKGPEDAIWLPVLPREPFLANMLCASSINIVERARQVFEQKVMRLGTGYMEYWLLAGAIGMLPPSSTPSHPATSIAHITNTSDDILTRCRKMLDLFTSLMFRVLALQKDPQNSFALSLGNTMASVSPSEGRTPSLNANAVGAGIGVGATPTASGHATFSAIPGMGMGMGGIDEAKDMGGPFDALQDMQVGMGAWSFPDFWAFDLDGDY